VSGGLEGYGPAIAASHQDEYSSVGLEALRPSFDVYPPGARALAVADRVPDPRSVSPEDPESIDVLRAVPAVEPALAFRSYAVGVALASRAVAEEHRGALREALVAAAERAIAGGGLPALDVGLYDDFVDLERRIFANGEPLSWRPLLAFAQGAFWTLSLMSDPRRSRGWGSPLEFVRALVSSAAELGYVPS